MAPRGWSGAVPWWLFGVGAALLLAGAALLPFFLRRIALRAEAALAAPPRRGAVELLYGLGAFSSRDLALLAQRAARGLPAEVAMAAPVARDPLTDLRFDCATLVPPASTSPEPDLSVTLGPSCRRPLRLSLPLLLSGMGWGVALSAEARLALAAAAQVSGVALVSGEGPVLAAERAVTRHWVWQWGRDRWLGAPGAAFLADMIELQVGQAAEGGVALRRSRRWMPSAVRRQRPGGGRLRVRGGLPIPLAVWIRRARRLSRGVPVGVKIPASQHVEADVLLLVSLGADVITLDGAGAGTASGPAVLADHLGIPVAAAIHRAHCALLAAGLRERVSLVASGHIHSAADVAKLLALGADAVALGSAALFALLQGQATKPLPARGPLALVLAGPTGQPGRLDTDLAAERLANWLGATRAELALLCQSLGLKTSRDLGAQHLVALRAETATMVGVAWCGAEAVSEGALATSRAAEEALSSLRQAEETWDRLMVAVSPAAGTVTGGHGQP
jgi:glutamate synthase domain-containing protein 2